MDAWEDYGHATRGEHFEWWSAEFLVQGQDRWSGQPLILERSWQAPIMYEALATTVDGGPYWKTVVIVVPRKNAKSTTLGGYAVYELVNGTGEPEILLAAGSDKQAGRLFSYCTGFRRRSEYLREELVARDYIGELARADGGGKIIRLSSEGDTQHGANPSLVIMDELHVWRTQKLRRSWGALTTADGARSQSQVFSITTEGEASGREESILGQLVDANEGSGDIERAAGVTISRDHESKTIIFRFHASNTKDADPRPLRKAVSDLKKAETAGGGVAELENAVKTLEKRLLESVMPANPASWISDDYILAQARSSKVMAADFMQLHANVAADSQERWIDAELWRELESDDEIAEGSEIAVAVDAALTHDSTAVVWAAKLEDGRVALRSRVWCAREKAAKHVFVEGGRIRNGPIKDFIRELDKRFQIVEFVYDPRYFEDAAVELADEGLMVAPMNQSGAPMRDAETQFHTACQEKLVTHNGDRVLGAHVAATVAEKTDTGWKLRKTKQSEVIDALVASVMAHYRARRLEGLGGYDSPDISDADIAEYNAYMYGDV